MSSNSSWNEVKVKRYRKQSKKFRKSKAPQHKKSLKNKPNRYSALNIEESYTKLIKHNFKKNNEILIKPIDFRKLNLKTINNDDYDFVDADLKWMEKKKDGMSAVDLINKYFNKFKDKQPINNFLRDNLLSNIFFREKRLNGKSMLKDLKKYYLQLHGSHMADPKRIVDFETVPENVYITFLTPIDRLSWEYSGNHINYLNVFNNKKDLENLLKFNCRPVENDNCFDYMCTYYPGDKYPNIILSITNDEKDSRFAEHAKDINDLIENPKLFLEGIYSNNNSSSEFKQITGYDNPLGYNNNILGRSRMLLSGIVSILKEGYYIVNCCRFCKLPKRNVSKDVKENLNAIRSYELFKRQINNINKKCLNLRSGKYCRIQKKEKYTKADKHNEILLTRENSNNYSPDSTVSLVKPNHVYDVDIFDSKEIIPEYIISIFQNDIENIKELSKWGGEFHLNNLIMININDMNDFLEEIEEKEEIKIEHSVKLIFKNNILPPTILSICLINAGFANDTSILKIILKKLDTDMFYKINFIGDSKKDNTNYISSFINSFRYLDLSNNSLFYDIFDLLFNKVKDYLKDVPKNNDYLSKLIYLDNIFNTKFDELSLFDTLFFGVELFNYQLTVNKGFENYISGVLNIFTFIFAKLNSLIQYINENKLNKTDIKFYFKQFVKNKKHSKLLSTKEFRLINKKLKLGLPILSKETYDILNILNNEHDMENDEPNSNTKSFNQFTDYLIELNKYHIEFDFYNVMRYLKANYNKRLYNLFFMYNTELLPEQPETLITFLIFLSIEDNDKYFKYLKFCIDMIPLNHLVITNRKKSYLFFILEIILKQFNSLAYRFFKNIPNLFFDKIMNVLKQNSEYVDNEKIIKILRKQLHEKINFKDYTIKDNKFIDNNKVYNINTKELLELNNEGTLGLRKKTNLLIKDYEKFYDFIMS